MRVSSGSAGHGTCVLGTGTGYWAPHCRKLHAVDRESKPQTCSVRACVQSPSSIFSSEYGVYCTCCRMAALAARRTWQVCVMVSMHSPTKGVHHTMCSVLEIG